MGKPPCYYIYNEFHMLSQQEKKKSLDEVKFEWEWIVIQNEKIINSTSTILKQSSINAEKSVLCFQI